MSVAAPTIERKGKNIILCFDGTGDWAGTDSTNVLKIYNAIDKSDPEKQLAYYDGGVGTLNPPAEMTFFGRTWRRLLDAAIATGLRDKALGGYDFLVQNYEPGDRIYLFGFSRGAYTARVLAGFLYNMGLLTKPNGHLSMYFWQTYSLIGGFTNFKRSSAKLRKDFTIGETVPIHFMGLFDTVSSVGIFKRFKTFPNTDKNEHVHQIRHAVSIDEQRNFFPEALFNPTTPGLVEVWFPGVHRDVGGGVSDEESGLPNAPLRWIAREAHLHGLQYTSEWEPPTEDKPIFHFGTFDIYVIPGLYPMKIWSNTARGFRLFWPNLIHVRPIPENALIDSSVSKIPKYKPENLPKKPVFFETATEEPQQPAFYEPPVVLPNIADAIGTTLGIMLGLVLTLRISQVSLSNLFDSSGFQWHVSGLLLAGVLVVLLFLQGLSQWFNRKLRGSGGLLPLVALALSLWLAKHMMDWKLLGAEAGVGFVIWAVAQLPPQLPPIRADRVLPLFVLPWLYASVAAFIVDRIFELYMAGHIGATWPYYVRDAVAIVLLAIIVAATLLGLKSILLDRLTGRDGVKKARALAVTMRTTKRGQVDSGSEEQPAHV